MFQISDFVSAKINNITDMMQASPLLDNDKFVKLVLAKTVPKKLQDHMGVDGICGRVPKAYVKAMCSSYFASQYVYRYGLSGNEVDSWISSRSSRASSREPYRFVVHDPFHF